MLAYIPYMDPMGLVNGWVDSCKCVSTSCPLYYMCSLVISHLDITSGPGQTHRSGEGHLPSGNLTFCHGKSPFFMGKSTISMAIFNSYVKLPEGKWGRCNQGINVNVEMVVNHPSVAATCPIRIAEPRWDQGIDPPYSTKIEQQS